MKKQVSKVENNRLVCADCGSPIGGAGRTKIVVNCVMQCVNLVARTGCCGSNVETKFSTN